MWRKLTVLFSANKKCDKSIKLLIDDETIDEVKNIKFLGVIIDKKLTWKYHINFVARNISRVIDIMVKAKKRSSSNTVLFFCLYLLDFLQPCMRYNLSFQFKKTY